MNSNYFWENCHLTESWIKTWLVMDGFILTTGLVTNGALLLPFLVEWKSLSASQVLGLNLAVMDLLFLCSVPLGFVPIPDTDQLATENYSDTSSNTTYWEERELEALSMFNLIGCLLLLACMCVERYLAVMKPVLYLRLRKLEYRVAVSAVVWAIAIAFCLARLFVADATVIIAPVCVIICCLVIVMLACLGGVIRSLQQQRPGQTSRKNQWSSESTLKRQAAGNVLVVVVSSVVAYLPVLIMFPMMVYINYKDLNEEVDMCVVYELSLLFPRFGVYIGPLFYFSKARQRCCRPSTVQQDRH